MEFDKKQEEVKVDVSKKIVLPKEEQKVPEKTPEELLQEMFEFAEGKPVEDVFGWIKYRIPNIDMNMQFVATYIARVVEITTIEKIKAEYVCLKKL